MSQDKRPDANGEDVNRVLAERASLGGYVRSRRSADRERRELVTLGPERHDFTVNHRLDEIWEAVDEVGDAFARRRDAVRTRNVLADGKRDRGRLGGGLHTHLPRAVRATFEGA